MNVLVICLLISGLIFFMGGSIGILRLPDFYTRLHAVGKLDTGGHMLTMSALILYTFSQNFPESIIVGLKIILIVAFIFITSPTATHAIIEAGFSAGFRPWIKKKYDDT